MPKLRPLPVKADQEEELHVSLPPEGEIEIELPGDDGGAAEVDVSKPEVKPVAKEAPKEADDNPLQKALEAQQRAEELQRTAQRERDDAQRQIRERDEELTKERGDRQEAEFNSVLTAIAAEESLLSRSEAEYAAFAAAGDWANASKAQRALATAASRLDRLEDSKQAFEKRDKPVTTETKAPPVAKPQDFEQRISQFPDRAKTWLREHPEFISDDSLNRKINATHQYLTETKGVQAFSPAYFEALDGEFGFKAGSEPEAKPQQRTRSIPMTAPVSRETVSPSGQRQSSTKITLSEEERLIARGAFVDRPDMPKMTDAQKEFIYAQNKQKLQKMRASGEYRQTSEQNG